jgi:hypothetical protein
MPDVDSFKRPDFEDSGQARENVVEIKFYGQHGWLPRFGLQVHNASGRTQTRQQKEQNLF